MTLKYWEERRGGWMKEHVLYIMHHAKGILHFNHYSKDFLENQVPYIHKY